MSTSNNWTILNSAFYKYLQGISLEERIIHLRECGLNHGDLYYRLADALNTYHPDTIAKIIEVTKVSVDYRS